MHEGAAGGIRMANFQPGDRTKKSFNPNRDLDGSWTALQLVHAQP
jgi:hypothetical protein